MEKVTIGADPEFVVKIPNTDTIVPGRCITKYTGIIGTDSVEDLVEIRPNPSVDVFGVRGIISVALRFLLDKSPKLQKMEFIAGHKGVSLPIGGHIHLGRLSKKSWFDDSMLDNSGDSNKEAIVIDLLDKLLCDGLHKVIQDKNGYNFRVKNSYGERRNYRRGHKASIIEYRTPPSWLVSPTLAFFYLCLAKVGGLLTLNYEDIAMEMIHKKVVGINLLKHVSHKIESIDELHAESDIQKLIGLIQKVNFKAGQHRDWCRDFKKAWGL